MSLRKKLDSLSLSPQMWIKFYSNRQAHFNVQASKEKKRVRHAFPCFYISDILSFFLLQGTGGSFKVTLALLVQHWIAAMLERRVFFSNHNYPKFLFKCLYFHIPFVQRKDSVKSRELASSSYQVNLQKNPVGGWESKDLNFFVQIKSSKIKGISLLRWALKTSRFFGLWPKLWARQKT